MKDRFIPVYANIAKEFASLSRARRLKVGAIIVKDDKIISCGFNGTPTGWNNNCEDTLISYKDNFQEGTLVTRPEVIHAEHNALYKLAKSNESGLGATMFCTHSPCIECAKGVFMSGIDVFYYGEEYRGKEGLEFLKKAGVTVRNWNI
jgi:dCMP deaminase